jgi:hypothetical protein
LSTKLVPDQDWENLVTEKFVSFEEERSLENAFKDHFEQQFNV